MTRRFQHNGPWSSLDDVWSGNADSVFDTISLRDDHPCRQSRPARYPIYINASDPNNLTVQFYGPNYTSTLNLVFEFSLLDPIADNPIIGGINGPSYECSGFSCTANDERFVDGGFAAATPLPATLPLFAGGLGFVGCLARRRKRSREQIRGTA
jgi:hypothetical protein